MVEHSVIELRDASIYHIKDARKKIGKGRNRLRGCELVLSELNIEVRKGEFVYLIGKVGSGKSTLLKTLYGEIPLAQGYGKVAGYDLRMLRMKDIPHLRRRLGIVFQDYKLLTDRNVFRNLHYVMRATGWKNEVDIRRRIEEILHIVGLVNKEYKMPFQLSGGEQQRLAIARSLINDPEVLLADEPTGNLDPASANGIMELFRSIAESGCAVVMSTHNINIIEEFPARTIRFRNGCAEEIDLQFMMSGHSRDTEPEEQDV